MTGPLGRMEIITSSKRGKVFARILVDSPEPARKPDFKFRFGRASKIKPHLTKSGTPLKEFLKWREEER